MKHYIEVSTRNSKEMNDICSIVHSWLVTINDSDIEGNVGLSFPEYEKNLGNVLRIHGEEKHISTVLGTLKLLRYRVSDITEVPSEVTHVSFSRFRRRMSESRLKRLIQRGNIKPDDVKKYRRKMVLEHTTDLPYMSLTSKSNSQHYRRYITKNVSNEKIRGKFDNFGISANGATVPLF